MANGEFIVACIDNSTEAYLRGTYEAQIVALKHYCKTKLADNSNTGVTVLSMASNDFSKMLYPVTDYKEIKLYLSKIQPIAGTLLFQETLHSAGASCARCPPNLQKRILLLVGSHLGATVMEMKWYGPILKTNTIAVDIVSFYLGEKLENINISNKYGTKELDLLFGEVNSGNSHIKHVELKDVKPSSVSIRKVLYDSIFSPPNHAAGEFIIACVDNSKEAYRHGSYAAQIVALKHYCKYKFADNSNTEVTLFSMASRKIRLHATDYEKIRLYLPKIHPRAGPVRFEETLRHAVDICNFQCPPNKQKRILLLVGSPVDAEGMQMHMLGSMLKTNTIAVDIVSFYLWEKLKTPFINNRCGTMELDLLFGAANSGNSHIKHVEPNDLKPRYLSIRKVLSESIFSPSSKTNHHEKEKGKSPAAGDNKHVGSEQDLLRMKGVKLGKRKAV